VGSVRKPENQKNREKPENQKIERNQKTKNQKTKETKKKQILATKPTTPALQTCPPYCCTGHHSVREKTRPFFLTQTWNQQLR
jgi:hypothetical protein